MYQSRYIEKILSKFSIADCKPCPTSCEMDITKTWQSWFNRPQTLLLNYW